VGFTNGDQNVDYPGALYDALVPSLSSSASGYLLFGVLLSCLGTWVLRARRNAAVLRPEHPFRYSAAAALAGMLVPVANLWFAGHVVAEIVDASRPPGVSSRRWPQHAWWICAVVAVLAHITAATAMRWTPLGRTGPATHPAPTPQEVAAQLTVTALHSVAAVALAAMAALLAVVVVRIGRWQGQLATGSPVAVAVGCWTNALAFAPPAIRPSIEHAPPYRAAVAASFVTTTASWAAVAAVAAHRWSRHAREHR
jgi:hypothetical protein